MVVRRSDSRERRTDASQSQSGRAKGGATRQERLRAARDSAKKRRQAVQGEESAAWKAQRSVVAERQQDYAPGKAHITLDLDAGTQISAEGETIIIASSIGYTVRLRFKDDPLLYQKFAEVFSGLKVMQRAAARIAKIEADRAAKEESKASNNQSSRPKIAGRKGAHSVSQAKRELTMAQTRRIKNNARRAR